MSLLQLVFTEVVDVEGLPPVCQDFLFLFSLGLLLRSPLSVLLDWTDSF